MVCDGRMQTLVLALETGTRRKSLIKFFQPVQIAARLPAPDRARAVSDCRTPNDAGMMLSKHLWNLGLNVGRVVNTSPRRWLRSVSRHCARIAIAPSLF